MPFSGQPPSNTIHNDVRKNPDIIRFLEQCPDIPRPEAKNIEELIPKEEDVGFFEKCKSARMPKYILSLDGSNYEAMVDQKYPSRKVGYIKISMIILNMEHYNEISSTNTRKYVDPMEVAKLQKDTENFSFPLPGSYVQFPEDLSPYETFRKTLLNNFLSEESKLSGKYLLDSLFELSRRILIDNKNSDIDDKYKAGINNVSNEKYFIIEKCPTRTCNKKGIFKVPFSPGVALCPHCGNKIFATDLLRVHEPFTNSGDNTGAFSRTRNVLEHIVLFHYIHYFWRENKKFLSEIGVILDGPLAIFGEGAKYHASLMEIYNEIIVDCVNEGYNTPIIMGLIKTGRVVEHFASIKNMMPDKVLIPIQDQYRYTFINEQDDSDNKNFGVETYYGQDFLLKTAPNRQFAINILYPFPNKKGNFHNLKTELRSYSNIESVVKIVMTFETDMFENGLTPIILAHKHASISLKPGGKMLDILSRNYFSD